MRGLRTRSRASISIASRKLLLPGTSGRSFTTLSRVAWSTCRRSTFAISRTVSLDAAIFSHMRDEHGARSLRLSSHESPKRNSKVRGHRLNNVEGRRGSVLLYLGSGRFASVSIGRGSRSGFLFNRESLGRLLFGQGGRLRR